MIQRIQSLYLLISLVLEMLQLQLTWVGYRVSDEWMSLTAFSLEGDFSGIWPLSAMTILTILLTILALGGFKNRALQMKWCMAGAATSLLSLGAFYMVNQQVQTVLLTQGAIEVQYHLTLAFPVVAIVLLLMARTAIRKDAELVLSADRIR